MKNTFIIGFVFISGIVRAQLFESQITHFNPAYTGMQDERFVDVVLSGFLLSSSSNFISSRASYQQNLENMNSGLGLVLGFSNSSFEENNFTTLNSSLSYRYAHRFENGLRVSAGTRLGIFHVRYSASEDAERLYGLILGFGGMLSYQNFTFGMSMPGLYNNFNGMAFSGSYKRHINDFIELTIISATLTRRFMFQQTLTAKAEFNQKIWFATRFNFDRNLNFYFSKFSTGLHLGCRFKEHFHFFGGTDFGFSSNTFSIYNPTLGFVYQFRSQN